MASVFDVAAYVLGRTGACHRTRLNYLLYYAQAWHLARDGRKVFPERVMAWANGPAVPAVYRRFPHARTIRRVPGASARHLTLPEKETVDAVLDFYRPRRDRWLQNLVQTQDPWVRTRLRCGLRHTGERGKTAVRLQDMQRYYRGPLECPQTSCA